MCNYALNHNLNLVVYCIRICHFPVERGKIYPFSYDAVEAVTLGNIVFLRHIMEDLLANKKIQYLYSDSDTLDIFSLVSFRPNFPHANYLHSFLWEDC